MRLSAVAGLAALLAGARASAPAPDAPPEVRVELVQVDAVVAGAHGKLVRDLTRDDFEVLEDGRPQQITHFLAAARIRTSGASAVPVPEGTAPSAAAALAADAPIEAAREPGRRIVVLVDDLHVARGNLEYAKQALGQLVGEFAAPDDDVALVTTSSGLVVQLTLDRAVLKQAINRLSFREAPVVRARGSRMTPAQAELILRGDRNALQLAARMLVEEPGSVFNPRSPQAAVEGAGGGIPGAFGSSDPERAAEKEAERQARGVLDEALRFSSASLSTVADVLHSLAPFPGRKICLLVSDGFLVGASTSEERTPDLQRLIDAATRSGAVVYSLDTRGLVPTDGDAAVAGSAGPPGLQVRLDHQSEQLFRETLRGVANDTGGFLVHGTNDLAAGLRRMLEDNDTYYMLAYESSNPKRDGRFRKIEVRVPRQPSLTVRSRRGYFAPDDRKLASKAAAPAPGALDEATGRAALAAPIPADGIPVRLVADYVELPRAGPQAVIRAHVDLGRLRWLEVEGRRQAAVELVGGVYDADGNPIGPPFGRTVELDLPPAEYKRAAEAGLEYQQQVALPPGRYQVRLVAHELKLAQSGGAAEWVEIPDLGQKKLTMSSVFLSSSAPPARGRGAAETPREASTLRRFQRGDSLYFQIYVYNALGAEKGASDVVLQAQIWSGTNAIAASKPQPVALRTRDDAPLPETNEVSLEGLAPGRYELRVVVVDRKANVTVFRRVDFALE